MTINICIYILKINAVHTAASVNIGQSLLADYHVSSKSSHGHGANYGDSSAFSGNTSAIDDRDVMDSNNFLTSDKDGLKDVILK